MTESFDQGDHSAGAFGAPTGEQLGVGVEFPVELQEVVLPAAADGFEHDVPHEWWFEVGIDALSVNL